MSKTPVPKQQKGEITSLSCFNRTVGDISDSRWRELIEDQDYDALIAEIREELIKQVADECYRKHISREKYKFLIECTYKAFQKIIPLHFYKYDDSYKYPSSQESWIADDEPLVCKPDSWAKGNIPYNIEDIPKDKYQQTVTVSSEYNLVKCQEYPSSHVFDTTSNTIELDEEDPERSCSCEDVLETEDLEPLSQNSVQFMNYDMNINTEYVPSFHDILPNRVASENTFYKIMKASKMSCLSIQTSVKGKKTGPPAWTVIDEIKDELKPHAYGPSRYLQMRRECLAAVDQKPSMKY